MQQQQQQQLRCMMCIILGDLPSQHKNRAIRHALQMSARCMLLACSRCSDGFDALSPRIHAVVFDMMRENDHAVANNTVLRAIVLGSNDVSRACEVLSTTSDEFKDAWARHAMDLPVDASYTYLGPSISRSVGLLACAMDWSPTTTHWRVLLQNHGGYKEFMRSCTVIVTLMRVDHNVWAVVPRELSLVILRELYMLYWDRMRPVTWRIPIGHS